MSKKLLDTLLLLPGSRIVPETSPPSPPTSPSAKDSWATVPSQEGNVVIEATLRPAGPSPQEKTDAVAFPACAVCGQTRYWLAPGGRVICGSKGCAGVPRFQIVALRFDSIH
jgi:hypothetical protein